MWANHIFEKYIHGRFMKTNKITIFHPTDSSSGSPWPESVTTLRAHPGQDALPSQGHSPPHTHSDSDNVAVPTDLTGTSLECGRNLESLENPHTDLGRTYILHTDSGPSQELISPLIIVITKWHWRKQCYWRRCCTVQLHLLRLGSSASFKLSCWFKYLICLFFLILLHGVVL